MSPIRPTERAKYPPDWRAIRARILERAKHACEWPGCGVAHGEVVKRYRRVLEVTRPIQRLAEFLVNDDDTWKVVCIILTVAHLNHDPADCRDENLRAWCQLHHLRYDVSHHRQTAASTRRAQLGNGELFV